jgi:hypothetical protein
MKKIIRLTESDLIKLVKRVINESTPNVSDDIPNADVRKVINTLEGLGWIESKTINVYEDHFEIYSIEGKEFDYFGMLGNYLIVDVEGEGDGINIYIRGEDYGEDDDIESKEVLMDYIIDNWVDVLSEKDIELYVNDDEEYY